MTAADEKRQIEGEIVRARDGVGNRIDELDRRLRTTLDLKSAAAEHAPQIITGGAVVGFLVGFGFPKIMKVALKVGLPLALIGFAVKKAKEAHDGDTYAEI